MTAVGGLGDPRRLVSLLVLIGGLVEVTAAELIAGYFQNNPFLVSSFLRRYAL